MLALFIQCFFAVSDHLDFRQISITLTQMHITLLLVSFVSSGIPYRVVIVPMKKLSIAMATVHPWVCVSGELGDSGVRQIPKNTQEIFFQVCALHAYMWNLKFSLCEQQSGRKKRLVFQMIKIKSLIFQKVKGLGSKLLCGSSSVVACLEDFPLILWDSWLTLNIKLQVSYSSDLKRFFSSSGLWTHFQNKIK